MSKYPDLERYNRNIIIEQINVAGQKKLFNAKILVAGSGGLGSTVIANLSSIGIGTIGIIDNDVLELSNLNRQYIHCFDNIGRLKIDSAKEWINNFNPEIKVKTFPIRLNEYNCSDILKDYDLVVDCFDSFESKFVLNRVCTSNNKILIHGGVTEFYGQVMTIIPGKTTCLRCIFPQGQEPPKVVKGVISPCVSTIASLQSMEVVKLILGFPEVLTDKLICFDGLTTNFKKLSSAKKANCTDCSQLFNPLDQ